MADFWFWIFIVVWSYLFLCHWFAFCCSFLRLWCLYWLSEQTLLNGENVRVSIIILVDWSYLFCRNDFLIYLIRVCRFFHVVPVDDIKVS